MKTLYLLIISLCYITMLQAQVLKTVELTPGSLKIALTSDELQTVTYLTIKGTMDARDFKTMRDSLPALAVLDLQGVKIAAFTEPGDQIDYPENTIPRSNPDGSRSWINYSLSGKIGLVKVLLPASLTDIGTNAFKGCTGLIEIEIPPLVVRIEEGAFQNCTSLVKCTLPPSILNIGRSAFLGCSNLASVELPPKLRIIDDYTFSECTSLASVLIPTSVNAINENAFSYCSSLQKVDFPSSITTIGNLSFYKCISLSSVTIPSSVTSIYSAAFGGCSNLTTVSLPRALKLLVSEAFGHCTSLTSIYSFASNPLYLEEMEVGVFYEVDKVNCTLYVPKGSKELYKQANQWKDFQHIVEMPGFTISATTVTLEPNEGNATFAIASDEDWTASTEESWLTVSPSSGSGDATLTVTSENNTSISTRLAKVVISITEGISQDITVVQKGVVHTIPIETAGTLYTFLSEDELTSITRLVITGEIDARDFKLIRDKMPFLEALDLSGTTIKAYSGTEGTDENTTDYQENEIPKKALENGINDRKSRLTTVTLPESVTAIREEAFSQCRALKDFEIPPSVITISYYAFAGCTSLTNLIIPSSTTTIGIQAFRGCKSLKNIELPSSISEIGNAAFETCDSLTSVTLPPSLTTIKSRLFYSCIGLLSVDIGPSATDIREEAFFYCTSLKSVNIPSSVTTIGYNAFALCYSLTSISSYPMNPPDLRNSGVVFSNVDMNQCILYVPYGSKGLYAAAEQWKDFKNIVEMTVFEVSATEVTLEAAQGSTTSITISGNVLWTATSDQPWLTIDPATGTGTQTITFTVEANGADTSRIAQVTVSAAGIDSKTIVITQLGIPTKVDERVQNRPSFTCYPNPFNQQVNIEIQNPKHTNITVDIYNMAGQKVKNVVNGNTAEQLNLTWDGTNDQSQKVPPGVYICKMNGQAKQLVNNNP